jgi:hypothetical protein
MPSEVCCLLGIQRTLETTENSKGFACKVKKNPDKKSGSVVGIADPVVVHRSKIELGSRRDSLESRFAHRTPKIKGNEGRA